MKNKRLTSSVCKKLALVKETAIREFAKDGDVLTAATAWAKFVEGLPREVVYYDYPSALKTQIENWLPEDKG